jgi:hypothetical protein
MNGGMNTRLIKYLINSATYYAKICKVEIQLHIFLSWHQMMNALWYTDKSLLLVGNQLLFSCP